MITRAERAANYAILLAFALFVLWPLGTIVLAALGPPDVGGTGGGLANFPAAWREGRFGTSMLTSVAVTGFVVLVGGVFSLFTGYAFGTMRVPGGRVLFWLFVLGLMVPAEVIVVPLYFDLRTLGLTNTFGAVAMPQVAQTVAFGTFWMRAYFAALPRTLIEAARLDGANSWRILWSVLVPAGRPAIVTMVVLTFMFTWNEFLIPLVMATDQGLRTAPLGLALFQGQHTSGFTLLAAGAVIVAAPVVIVYLFLQRHFIRGMLDGALRE
ncbi:carbohydrate ABC transporter permease [Pseudonocardia eucalypti]|uniref:Carbohydrate ABC transporter permease n=1 Tax=Pseudonocardia eucalypti TaxID=648755 RepID=A0ABP9PS59_9PSEU|nr:raffinose/stachyose/melibiose transport system permease protein [Pseudonocardia eucalypti]